MDQKTMILHHTAHLMQWLVKPRWTSVLLSQYLKHILTLYYYWFKYFLQGMSLLIPTPTAGPVFPFLVLRAPGAPVPVREAGHVTESFLLVSL